MTATEKKKLSIVIVDDDNFLLDMYVLKFKEKGYDVAGFSDSTEALARLEDKTYIPAAVLLDGVMPGMDGFEMLKRLRDKKIVAGPVIIFSNLGEPSDIQKAKDLKADGYIIKANTTPSEVVSRVEELLKY